MSAFPPKADIMTSERKSPKDGKAEGNSAATNQIAEGRRSVFTRLFNNGSSLIIIRIPNRYKSIQAHLGRMVSMSGSTEPYATKS